jgi:8-oxo-dGTP pyrophosphatase MutT (NUDIX family)
MTLPASTVPPQPSPSSAFVRARMAERSTLATAVIRGDGCDSGGPATSQALRDAAVLVPLLERTDGLTVLLTRRTAHLAAHAGQISFPGGGTEADDDGPTATALRETEEEIGLARKQVDVVGQLDTYITGTGFRIAPVVGLVRPPFQFTPDASEVDVIFEAPLDFILNPDNRRRESRPFKGRERSFWAFRYGEHYIWGATAGILVNLTDILIAPQT